MIELFAGIAGGLGLFMVGMRLLTEHLSAIASRRLRRAAARWTGSRWSALAWGTVAGCVFQSMTALTFIVVGILRSGLITTRGALALILGGCIGVTLLVLVVTFDIKVVALFVLGVAGAVVASDRLSRFRAMAWSLFGGAMLILGLVLLKDAAAPLAHEPWFAGMLESAGESLLLAFAIAALLTFVVQSASVVCVFAISMATVGVLSVDQAIMAVYGTCIGSSASLYLLTAGLTGRSRQVAMYMVLYDLGVCAVLVPLLYAELHFDIPLLKALVLGIDLALAQQLALVYVSLSVLPLPLMVAGLDASAAALERLWPDSQLDELSAPKFIHDHAAGDVETALVLVDLEQRRAFANLSRYFERVREGRSVRPLRDASRKVLADLTEVLEELQTHHPGQAVEERIAMANRQKLLGWLEEALGSLCGTLAGNGDGPALARLRTTIRESVDGVLLAVVDTMESDDTMSWEIAKRLSDDRGAMMREFRIPYLEMDPPLAKADLIDVLLITNAVEETFFVLSKLVVELDRASGVEAHVPHG